MQLGSELVTMAYGAPLGCPFLVGLKVPRAPGYLNEPCILIAKLSHIRHLNIRVQKACLADRGCAKGPILNDRSRERNDNPSQLTKSFLLVF